MIRHVSIFSLRDVPEKRENLAELQALLEQVPGLYPPARRQRLYRPAAPAPALPEDAPILFGDLIQIVDFETSADAEGYPDSEAHRMLAERSGPALKKVTAMDYEVEDPPCPV